MPDTLVLAGVSHAIGAPQTVKILVVDDREDKRIALEAMLAGEGIEVVAVDSGAEALRRLLKEDFALVLLDVMMPIMDGFETAGLIRSRKRSEHTPIIFITAHGKEEAMPSRGYALGAVDFVYNPIDEVTLKAKAGVFVELERTRQALRSANERLECKVRARTSELERVNRSLEEEVRTRREAEGFLKASLEEKEALLKEVHHRVKNNLQIIISLLRLQSGKTTDPGVLDQLKDSQNRIRAMALVHEKLYRSKDLDRIGFAGYVRDLATQVFRSFGAEQRGVNLEMDVQDIEVAIDFAVPCGLILHELLSNALKHAFPTGTASAGDRPPTIRVRSADAGEGGYRIEVEDNGVGFPAGKPAGDSRSLGMKLVNALVGQLGGILEAGGEGAGTTFRFLVFPGRGEA